MLPKLKQFLRTVGPIVDHVGYLIELGFAVPSVEFLYNDKCKDLFACMLIVIAYLFLMNIPQQTGAQDLRGIIVAESDTVKRW